jgi:hypothetical protein
MAISAGSTLLACGGLRCVPTTDRICLMMDVSGRIVRVQDERFDVGWAEMKYPSFTVINPDRRIREASMLVDGGCNP